MMLCGDKSKAEIIEHWRRVLANPSASIAAHWMAKEAIESLTKYEPRETDEGNALTKRDQAPG